MRGIYNAVKDGHVKADDAFPVTETKKDAAGAGSVSGSDLGGKL